MYQKRNIIKIKTTLFTVRLPLKETNLLYLYTFFIRSIFIRNKIFYGQVRLFQVMLGQDWLDQVRGGQVRLDQVRLGQVRLGQYIYGNFIWLGPYTLLLSGPNLDELVNKVSIEFKKVVDFFRSHKLALHPTKPNIFCLLTAVWPAQKTLIYS